MKPYFRKSLKILPRLTVPPKTSAAASKPIKRRDGNGQMMSVRKAKSSAKKKMKEKNLLARNMRKDKQVQELKSKILSVELQMVELDSKKDDGKQHEGKREEKELQRVFWRRTEKEAHKDQDEI